LGPGYVPKKEFNTIVTNHSSYIDVIYLSSRYFCSFVSKKEIADTFIGVYSNAIKCIYFDRSRGKEAAIECVSFVNLERGNFRKIKGNQKGSPIQTCYIP